MPVVNAGRGRATQNQPPPALPSEGAWSQDGEGHWTWVRGATPDPALVSLWGNGALTDVRRDPTGQPNYGAWTPQHGGGWTWTWGVEPQDRFIRTWGREALTDPSRTPNGAEAEAPPLPDVNPPELSDSWNGRPPDVTGDVPEAPTGDGAATVTEPPAHPAFVVSPGSIRDAEFMILRQIDTTIAAYDAARAAVSASRSQNVYMDGNAPGLLAIQDRVLLQASDVIRLAGQFVAMLNAAAQNYAHADIASFLHES